MQQANNRYRGGVSTFLDTVVVENIALQADLTRVRIVSDRQIASVQLIKALGGGWTSLTKPDAARK